MANLVSPGVSVTITDESFFIPASASTVPLIFVATAAEKKQPNGISDAAGTFEHDIIRTVSSLKQSTELYGVPRFLQDVNGQQMHGDARNEYGLFALNQFLGIGNLAYVIRANVNLNDDLESLRDIWDSKMEEAGYVLENLVNQYLLEYNQSNGYVPNSGQGVATTNTLVGGALYTAGTYTNVALTGGTGMGARATITVAGGEVTVVTITTPGQNYTVGDTLTAAAADIGGTGAGFSIDVASVTGDLYRTTVTRLELNDLVQDATEHVWDFSSFAHIQSSFINDYTSAPQDVFANGYGNAATTTFIGFEGLTADWEVNESGATLDYEDQFTPSEAGTLLIGAADDFKFTIEFLNKTSLGANDAARRSAIVTALQATINSNTDIRGETYEYNLIVCPGFHEVVDEMLNLCVDIQEEAFVIADTPMNLDPEAVVTWAGTVNRNSSRNVAYYYPHCLASNLDGVNVVVAASGTALRTIAYSDDVAELWFAPAGTRRGLVSGVTSVGYISGTLGTPTTYNEVALNQGQRDNLYKYFTNINPIVFFPGRGIIVFGQKTSAPDASALDRINVMRLVMYVKRSLRKNTMSFIFEPNDQLTRDNLKATVDNFLGDLIVKRGLYDFATVCDDSNNTPDRIDRNEMYVDVALKPVRAAEFIYIPIRIVATGAEI